MEVDLASCYTAILLGLYYQQLPSVLVASTKGSLWGYIRLEFVKLGFEKSYDKTSIQMATWGEGAVSLWLLFKFLWIGN